MHRRTTKLIKGMSLLRQNKWYFHCPRKCGLRKRTNPFLQMLSQGFFSYFSLSWDLLLVLVLCWFFHPFLCFLNNFLANNKEALCTEQKMCWVKTYICQIQTIVIKSCMVFGFYLPRRSSLLWIYFIIYFINISCKYLRWIKISIYVFQWCLFFLSFSGSSFLRWRRYKTAESVDVKLANNR